MKQAWTLRLALLLSLTVLGSPSSAQMRLPKIGGGGNEAKVQVTGRFVAPIEPDGVGQLVIVAEVDPGWHIYSITQPKGAGSSPSEIKLDPSPDYTQLGPFQPNPPPEKRTGVDGKPLEVHEGTVIWAAPAKFSAKDLSALRITGSLRALACTETNCDRPRDHRFILTKGEGFVGPPPSAPDTPTSTAPPPGEAGKSVPPGPPPPPSGEQKSPEPPTAAATETTATGEIHWRDYSEDKFRRVVPGWNPELMQQNVLKQIAETSFLKTILFAFVGGLLLNIMPCVLPVIGLKLLSFVEQSGQDRRRVIALNVVYSAGLLSVFLLLAALAVGLHFGWGHLFRLTGFNVFMAAVVFAMGLSFLGVWEIPIPGFAGHGKLAGMAESEGYSAAFLKGVFTTLLATPCTGPFMGGALTWALNQPASVTFAVFASVGLGMASPYLLIGAFPALIRYLPKPGAWMDTFKHLMGFVLLGTVVYIFTFLEPSFVVPTVGLLFAIWAGCWWIGREGMLIADLATKLRAWMQAAAFVGVMWILLFPGTRGMFGGDFGWYGLQEIMAGRLPQPQGDVDWRVPPGRYTVLIDFTADWCQTCKYLERYEMNTAPVREILARNGVLTLKGDVTREAPEVQKLLKLLGSDQVPVIAIFPADDPNNPIVFRNGYTKASLIDALEQAGPSTIRGGDLARSR